MLYYDGHLEIQDGRQTNQYLTFFFFFFVCFIGFQRFTIIESKINQNKNITKKHKKQKQNCSI